VKLALVILSAVLALSAVVADDHSLEAIKGSVFVPEGWFFKEHTEDGVSVYEVTREKVETDNDTFQAGLILTATPKIPDRASMKPSEYAEQLLTASQDTPPAKSQEGPLQCLRSEYTIESDQGNIKTVSIAKANDKTGTLYFITWQSPAGEEDKMKELRERILGSLKLDPNF